MADCGRVRKKIRRGWTQIVDGELRLIKFAVLNLNSGDKFELDTQDREYAIVLIKGEIEISLHDGQNDRLGPRNNPFEHMPYGAFITREQRVTFRASDHSFLGVGSSPAEIKKTSTIVRPDIVKTRVRGAGNWSRQVRMVCWSDNTEGNLLIAGETCTPSGNWSSMPPHRHQYDIPGEEFAYEEIYFFQFSRPQGFGLTWQFDDEGMIDQAFSLKTGDTVYMSKGYHPVVCGPGSMLYQLTLMAGSNRMSQASVHKDYRYLLKETDLANQYTPDV